MPANSLSRRQVFVGLGLAAVEAASSGWTFAAPSRRLQGVFPIGFTPVDSSNQVDFDGLAAQVKFCTRGGVHGIAWPQIASGWTVLTEDERIHGAEALVSAARGTQTAVVIGVQSKSSDFKETERYAQHAAKVGADAIICIPPSDIAPGPALISFYQDLGKVTTLPMFIQTGGNFSVDAVMQLFDAVPTFRYIKDEAGDPLERVTELRARSHEQLHVFSGRGVNTMISEMERGFEGHCPFVSFSDLYASAYDAFHAGDKRKAFDQFGRIEAASSMFAQNDVNILIARGVFKPGTTSRMAPPPPGADMRRKPSNPDDVRRAIDAYLKPYLRA
jgi:dihydrodipicolinate synthase/N-acetylneuraminate lyase